MFAFTSIDEQPDPLLKEKLNWLAEAVADEAGHHFGGIIRGKDLLRYCQDDSLHAQRILKYLAFDFF